MELGLGLLLTPVKSPLLLATPDTYPVYVLDSTSAQLSIEGGQHCLSCTDQAITRPTDHTAARHI